MTLPPSQSTPPPVPSSAAPPNREHILTEQRNPRSMDLHTLDVRACVDLFNRENWTALEAMERAAEPLATFIEPLVPRYARGGRLIYVGAGTSGRLGVLDASECPPTFQVPPDRVIGIIAGGDGALRVSSEGKEDDPHGAHLALEALALTTNDTLLGIAAGGTTPYVHGAIAFAKARGAMTGLLSCSPVPAPPGCDHLIVLEAGPEVLTGSTRLKAGTATKLALNTISTTLMVQTGRVYQNLMVDVKASNDKLRDRAARIIAAITGLSREASLVQLDAAGGVVKTAITMHTRGLDRASAESYLRDHHGRL